MFIKATNLIKWGKDMEYSHMLKEENMMVNGKWIKCKEEVLCTMQMRKLHMKDNGMMIN